MFSLSKNMKIFLKRLKIKTSFNKKYNSVVSVELLLSLLFKVNDLYENKNLYMIVDNLYSLGGLVSYSCQRRVQDFLNQEQI